MERKPLTEEDVMALRFTQLRLAAKAYDARRHWAQPVQAEIAYRDTRRLTLEAQTAMRNGDAVDADLIGTNEENNDRVEHGTRARYRRAFAGLAIADLVDDEESLRIVSAIRSIF